MDSLFCLIDLWWRLVGWEVECYAGIGCENFVYLAISKVEVVGEVVFNLRNGDCGAK